MGITFALDELYATGWSPMDTSGCEHAEDGRWFPTPETVGREFAAAGCSLRVTHIQLFDCYRAEWSDDQGRASGAVVGQSEHEATVYALSQLRRALSAVH